MNEQNEELNKENQETNLDILSNKDKRLSKKLQKIPFQMISKKQSKFLNTPPFEVIPPQIVFHNVEEKKIYQINFAIRNITQKNIKIKFTQPHSLRFKVECDSNYQIAPGLSLPAKLTFNSELNEEIFSKFLILTENSRVEVPISVFPPSPFIIFEPYIDFGYVDINSQKSKKLIFKNEGIVRGEVNFLSKNLKNIEIEPNFLSLEPEEEKQITFTIRSTNIGILKELINLEIKGHSIYKAIECSANIIQNHQFIIDEDEKQIQDLDFQKIIIGKKKTKKIFIINNSPYQAKFNVNLLRGFHSVYPEQTQVQTPFEKGREQTEKILQIEPQQGVIEQGGRKQITFTIHSQIQDIDKVRIKQVAQSQSHFISEPKILEYTTMFEFNEVITNINLLISAKCYLPQVYFEETQFDFDQMFQGNKKIISFTIENLSDQISVRIKSPNEFFLHSEPKDFKIEPSQKQIVNLTFIPSLLGVVCKTLNFVINGQIKIPIKIFGYVNYQNKSMSKTQGINSLKLEKMKQKLFYVDQSSNLKLPSIKNQLNQNFETQSLTMTKRFEPDPNISFKEFPTKSKKQENEKLTKQKLTGEQLMKIKVGPLYLDFGKIFVKSRKNLFFQIRNETGQMIKAQMQVNNHLELQNSYKKCQIIPEDKIAGFKISFSSTKVKKFSEKISYIINDYHIFNFVVQAEVIPVDLELSSNNLKFFFNEESLDMNVVEEVTLFNNGNDIARFQIKNLEKSTFEIDCQQGEIQPLQYKKLNITYKPSGFKDEENIELEIENGESKVIHCEGTSNETQCELSTKHLNLGTIGICQTKETNFIIENKNNKFYAIFQIDQSSLPEGLKIKPLIGKIVLNAKQKFEVEYSSQTRKSLNGEEFYILIRGSKKLRMLFSVQTILPEVQIDQEIFDFKEVIFGTKGILQFTFSNKSQINAEIFLNLTSQNPILQKKLDCIEIQTKNPNENYVLEKIGDQFSENQSNIQSQEVIQNLKNYLFYLKGEQSYNFIISFTPISDQEYLFEIPFFVNGKDRNPLFIKKVKCKGSKPKFLMESLHGLDFPRKIILSSDTVIPEYRILSFSNPDFDNPLIWNFDQDIIKKQKVFSISPTSGVIEPQCTITIDVGFQPFKAQSYELLLPLYFDNQNIPYNEILLKGEGAYPKLLFDTEEVIFDVVPLNQSVSYVLNIFNDGYNNSNISAVIPQEYQQLPIKIKFLNGSTIGVNNPNLQIEFSFISSTPISFTMKVEFEDEQKRIFPVFISGTADNSILTNFLYFIDNTSVEIKFDNDKGPIIGMNKTKVLEQVSMSQSQVIQFNDQTIGQYEEQKLIKLKRICDSIKIWFREYGIANINNFPEDIIQNNGNQIFDLINFLVKNNLSKYQCNGNNFKKNEKIQGIIENYSKMLKFLKEHNAMLNQIRPQLLLSYKELLSYYKTNSNIYVHPNFYKLKENKFQQISLQNWILLFNQILKIFYFSRINSKSLKQIFVGVEFKPTTPLFDYNIEKNTIYSVPELVLLKWVEILKHQCTGQIHHFKNFESDFNDSVAIASALESYILLDLKILNQIKLKGTSREEISFNFEKVKKYLVDYGIKDEIYQEEFQEPNPIGFLLLTMHLFKLLPNFLPKSKIDFNCALHETVRKEIQFNNPAPKTIIYSIKLHGHQNFKIEQDILKLDPKQSQTFPIQFYANTSLPAQGKIIFQNRRNGNSIAGAICFDLSAQVQSRFSMKTLTINNVNLYDLGTREIEVVNPFDRDVDFKIQIQCIPYEQKQISKKSNKKGDKKIDTQFLPSFFIKLKKIWIYKNSTAKIYLMYLPLTFETHKCNLIFLDPNVGEMQYEVLGVPKMPQVYLPAFKYNKNVDEVSIVELQIPYKNNFFNQGCLKLIEKLKEQNEKELIPYIEQLQSQNDIQYQVDVIPSNFFIAPETLSIGDKEQNQNVLKLQPVNKNPVKDLQFQILLKDSQKMNIRVYQLLLTISPKVISATIEMHSTARQPIIQEIPVSNPTDIDCQIKPVFLNINNGQCFDCPQQIFTVKKKSIGKYTIKYIDNWIGKSEAQISLQNQITNDNFKYNLIGETEEPLSEDHFKFKVKAKKETEIILKIKNPIQGQNHFKVDCDIPYSQYNNDIYLDFNKQIDYEIKINPKIGGSFMNAITFTDKDGKYFWYLITVDVEAPESVKTFDIFTEIRKPTVCKIDIKNEQNKEIMYKVIINGQNLSGDSDFYIEPQKTSTYNLIYYPFKIEKKLCRIGFLNDQEGEIWYDLNVQAIEGKPERLQLLTAELGKSQSVKITLKNPLKKKSVNVISELPKESNFQVNYKNFILQPKEKKEITINYMPKELNKKETELIVFSSKELGTWKFMVFGIGVPPTDFDTVNINSVINKTGSKTISFRNPFSTEINVQVILEQNEKIPVFELLMNKQKNVQIQSQGVLQFAIRFKPLIIKSYEGRILVKFNKKIYWVYPLLGMTEACSLNQEIHLNTKCGQEIEKNFNYEIQGLENIDPNDEFTYNLQIKHKESLNIEKWFKIKTLKNKINQNGDQIQFVFSLLPFKPFKAPIDMLISKQSGGRWRVKIYLEAEEPDYFDTITIISSLNVKKTIQFKLFNNDKKQSSNFLAYFSQDSDTEFTVEPSKGILQPMIKDGTMIQISYLPIEYGKLKIGNLIIETESFMWKFLVKGAFKKYLPPSKKNK